MDGEVELLGERIAEQAAHLDAATHLLLANLREFDARGGWHRQGAKTCAHWLAWRVGWDLITARERVRVAKKLGEFPTTDDALRRGELSYSKVRAIVRVATPANEAMLLDCARLSTASQLENLSRKYAMVRAHDRGVRTRDDEQRRYVRRRDTADGMVKIEAVLHPEEAELIWAMLDHAAKHLAREPLPVPGPTDAAESPTAGSPYDAAESPVVLPRTDAAESPAWLPVNDAQESPTAHAISDAAESLTRGTANEHGSQQNTPWADNHPADPTDPPAGPAVAGPARPPSVLYQAESAAKRAFNRADALMAVAQAYLRGNRPNRTPIDVMVTIPLSDLRGSAADPTAVGCMGASGISTEAARRISCDAGVIEVIEDEHGVPLSVGRKRRAIAGSIKRALLKRDTACTFPGCGNRVFLEAHHVRHWADGGETSLMNACLVCSLHHRYVHEHGYTIELDLDQRPQFRDPHGRLVTAVPARSTAPDLGWPHIRAAHEALEIDAETIACEWDGTPMPYGTLVGQLIRVDGLQ